MTQDRWDLKDHKALGAHKELPVPPDRRGRLAQGLPGLTGPQGPAGIGLTDGAVLFLKPGSVPPAGFVRIGTSKVQNHR